MFDYDKFKLKYITRADLIYIACVLTAAVLLVFLFLITGIDRRMAVAVVEQDGKEILRLALDEQQTVRIPAENGFNVVVVTGRGVLVSEADCPDQICVRQGEISHSGESVVCLPHRLVIRLEGAGDDGLDAMTN